MIIFFFSYASIVGSDNTYLINNRNLNNCDKESEVKNDLINRQIFESSNAVYYADTNGYSFGIDIDGNIAYIADYSNGIVLQNITNCEVPTKISTVGTYSNAYDVMVSGDLAYVADFSSGLTIINISNSNEPVILGNRDTNGYSKGIFVSGNFAYLADRETGLAIINITDPTNPSNPIYKYTSGLAVDVFVDGNFAYIADSDNGLAIVNITNPNTPSTPIYCDTTGTALEVMIFGDLAFVADGASGLAIINITDPTNPGNPIYISLKSDAKSVFIDGNFAYMGLSDGSIAVINITNWLNPGEPNYLKTNGEINGLCVRGNYLFAADYNYGMAVIKIAYDITPDSVDYRGTSGRLYNIYAKDSYVYISDLLSGVEIINISDPSKFDSVCNISLSGAPFDVSVSGNFLYVADYASGLAIIDITDPTNPGTPIYVSTSAYATGIFVEGNYAYVAVSTNGLAIIDISDPTNPGIPVYMDTADWSEKIYVKGNFAYIADGNSGLAILNISDPTNPGAPIYIDTNGYARGITVDGNFAFVADENEGVKIINVTDPTNPGTPILANVSGDIYDLTLSGNRVYVAVNIPFQFAILDVSDPINPGEISYYNLTDNARDVAISGDYLYIADYEAGIARVKVKSRIDLDKPIFTSVPDDLIAEYGYSDGSISFNWTVYDEHPNNYTIELIGSGIVEGPLNWSNNETIQYSIPEGLAYGNHTYIINCSDIYGYSNVDNVSIFVNDTIAPKIINNPINKTIEANYSGEYITWTATDGNPLNYTIELLGDGIVSGPNNWLNGNSIIYNIPNGMDVGNYTYIIKIEDIAGNYVYGNMTFSIIDTTAPIITSAPDNVTLEYGYSGVSLGWVATDYNPSIYTIELLGSGTVFGPATWFNGSLIIFNIPDGKPIGNYTYIFNCSDIYGHYSNDVVNIEVIDNTAPIISQKPEDLYLELGYSSINVSWEAVDGNANNYSIVFNNNNSVIQTSNWTSNEQINLEIPKGFDVGNYSYTINFWDSEENNNSDILNIYVDDTISPIFLIQPSNLTLSYNYEKENISWICTDLSAGSYSVFNSNNELLIGPLNWTNGTIVSFSVPENLTIGNNEYYLQISDQYGNTLERTLSVIIYDDVYPIFITTPEDIVLEIGYNETILRWNVSDDNPLHYIIELDNDSNINNNYQLIVNETKWYNREVIEYTLPTDLIIGVYYYNITIFDLSGNQVSNIIKITIQDEKTIETTSDTNTNNNNDNDNNTSTSEDNNDPNVKNSNPLVVIIIMIFGISVLSLSGIFYYNKGKKKEMNDRNGKNNKNNTNFEFKF